MISLRLDARLLLLILATALLLIVSSHVVLDFLQIGRCSARRVAGCGTVDKSNGDGGDDSIDICWTAGIAILKVKRD